MNSKNIKIIVATHKKYKMPSDDMYLPVQVGAEGKNDLGYSRDCTGDNISSLNSSFCELTGLYWAWKNLNEDYIGLVHYRRYFSLHKKRNKWDSILKYEQIKPYLNKFKIFVPKKRQYYMETLYSHYAHTHYAKQLDETRMIISKIYPDYLNSFDKIMKQRSGYMFNMMIMQKDLLNEYCIWLFNILFALSKNLEMPDLSKFQGRFYGRVSEIIFNVWLDHQITANFISENDVRKLSCIHMEKINWLKKGSAFIKAKFFHQKYEGSF